MEKRVELFILAADNPIGKKQRRIFKRKRAGEVLTREQVAAIKAGRKLLRKEMKAQGIKKKSDFELTASSMGLYFDKRKFLGLLWFFRGRGLWALLGALAALLAVLMIYASVTEMRGHFTINMSGKMFREGFTLSETEDFRNPTTHLFCEPAVDVPCISISSIPNNVDNFEGQHNDSYFAYTFWVRNEGESTVDYTWSMNLNSESLNLSQATWVMIFEDGEMIFYAEPDEEGRIEALPPFGDNSRGYLGAPMSEHAKHPDRQYQLITTKGNVSYYRVIPEPYVSEDTVAEGIQTGVDPMEKHKYTVVIWLEGDDPDCTNDLIGGHVGMDFNFRLVEETEEEAKKSAWEEFWSSFTE